MRVFGIDYGDRRIGIAVSDDHARLAVPRGVLENRGLAAFVEELCRTVKEDEIGTVVFGLPLALDGSEGSGVARVQECAEKLQEACGVQVAFEDERLTTMGAERERRIRGDVPSTDADAAVLILQSYLDRQRA